VAGYGPTRGSSVGSTELEDADVACVELEIEWQTWLNELLTCGILCDKLGGATWPRHGLPRDTLWYGKILVESMGIKPRTSRVRGELWKMIGYRCTRTIVINS
jgi:hypothetical protein